MGKGKTGISVYINRKEAKKEAESIIRTYAENEEYLRNLINDYVPANTRKSVEEMSYSELLHYGRVIRGVAMKVLNSQNITEEYNRIGRILGENAKIKGNSLEAKANKKEEKQLSLF